MKRFIILVLLLTAPLYAGISGYELRAVNEKIPGDWFRTGGTKDYGTNAVRNMENLIALSNDLDVGEIFYVDSSVTTEGNGTSWETAKDTLNEAIDLCTNSRRDFIFIAGRHNEALIAADAADIDQIGVTVIGRGYGNVKPTFDYDQSAGELVIGADGVESRVGRWANLDTTTALHDIETCVQYTMEGLNIDPECCQLHFGGEIAPGGYLWIFPKGPGVANVGLGISGENARRMKPSRWRDVRTSSWARRGGSSRDRPRLEPLAPAPGFRCRAPIRRRLAGADAAGRGAAP